MPTNSSENGGRRNSRVLHRLLDSVGNDAGQLLHRMRKRFDAVDLKFPQTEIRFQDLKVDAYVHEGSRALPTIPNFIFNTTEAFLRQLKIFPGRQRQLSILNNISGIIRPSRMTLLLGPPGSGKTTLLLALAGRLGNGFEKMGSITYNGKFLKDFVPQTTSAYVSQKDWFVPEMTVRETLEFAGHCQGVGSKYGMFMELTRREKNAGIKPDEDLDIFMKALALAGEDTSLIVEYIMKILGLDICADILVGDEMIKGISGGQKKRLSTGEIVIGPARVLLMDEITTGLDSSTAYEIIEYLRHLTHAFDGTTLISLLQPTPELYELFDDVILICEGHIVYQGPRAGALEFFAFMGFKCPKRKNVADFLQEVTSVKDQQQYWSVPGRPYQYVPVMKFAEAFCTFHIGQSLSRELAHPYDRWCNHPTSLSMYQYGVGRAELLKASFKWQVLLMKRNLFIYIFKLVQILFVAVITMTVFFRTNMHHRTIDDGVEYLGAIYFSTIIILFNGFTEVALLIAKLPVLYKHRDLHFYPCWVYSFPLWALSIPTSLAESAIWVIVTYYAMGFDPQITRFLHQLLLYFSLHQMSLPLFRLMASLGRNMIVANTIGSFALLIIMALGGFILSKDSIPSWWRWGYWFSPMMYAQNAVSINEFLGHSWDKKVWKHTNASLGEEVLRASGLLTDGYWYWIGLGALLGYTVIFNILLTISLNLLDPLRTRRAVISNQEMNQKKKVSSFELRTDKSLGNFSGLNFKGQRGMALPFKPVSMCFRNINYNVDVPVALRKQGILEDRLQLLANVTGAFRPGVLTALVGVSGAGKTTLMDVLSGRKTGGLIEGSITINGHPKKQETFARIAGYCEQDDIHSPCMTVHESLIYSAWLRLPSYVDLETQKVFVDEVMDLVELTSLCDALVGQPGVDGLSTEQRKRLTIATELVANPSIVFMDEPTSGLDARAAAIVMRTVRNIVDTGRTIVCTVHQPSIDIFESFDELLFMKQGGELIYAGPLGTNSKNLIEYLESIDGVPKMKAGYNPATWMLEVTSPAKESQLGTNFGELYRKSSLFQKNNALVESLLKLNTDSDELTFPTKYSQPFRVQFLACLWKQNRSYWRNPQYTAVRFFYTIIVSLILGTICWKSGSKRGKQQDVSNAMGSMYAAVIFMGITNATAVQPVVSTERLVSYRERAAGMYSALPFALAQVVIEFPYVFVQTLIYGTLFYFMASFEWDMKKFFSYLFFMYFTLLYFTFFGMMTSAITPNQNIAPIVAAPFYMLWNLFCGFVISHKSLPGWWRWYYWANPMSWSLYGLLTSQYGNMDEPIKIWDGSHSMSIRHFLEHYFGFRQDFLGLSGFMVIGFTMLFALIFAFAIKSLNFQKR